MPWQWPDISAVMDPDFGGHGQQRHRADGGRRAGDRRPSSSNLALLHSGVYLATREPTDEDRMFSGLLRLCIPDIDLIMDQQARLMYAQIADG